jgi:hypothetical protein
MVSLRAGQSTVYNTQKCDVRPEGPARRWYSWERGSPWRKTRCHPEPRSGPKGFRQRLRRGEGSFLGARIGVTTFEDFGRKLDHEIERLREVAAKKITPAARLKTAKSLRRMSDKLAQIAADLESKVEPKPDSR